jgi:hypothetical protein
MTIRTLGLLVALAVLAVGCDGDDAPADTPRPPIEQGGGWLMDGKWQYSPPGSTCVYVETRREKALHRDFDDTDVILMDSENCRGTWYVYYPETGVTHGAIIEPDDPRLRLRLVEDKVVVEAGPDGCSWSESRRQADSQSETGGIIVVLSTTCDYDHALWYFPETGDLDAVVS